MDILGRYWASINDDHVVSLIRMPENGAQDKEVIAEEARQLLSRQGKVVAGELIRTEEGVFLKKRLTHANRSKNNQNRVSKLFKLV